MTRHLLNIVILTTWLIIILSDDIHSQTIDSTLTKATPELLDTLISIAWENYPKNKVFQHLLNHADEKVFQETWSWLNTVNITYQYIPNNLPDQGTFAAPPQLGLGFVINVGSIFSTPSRVSQAKEEKLIAQANLDNQKNYIAAEVMRRYYKLLENLNLLKVHVQAAEDSELIKNMIKYRFEQGEVNLEEYSRALTLFTDGQENMTKTNGKVNASVYSLEEILGVKLKEIL